MCSPAVVQATGTQLPWLKQAPLLPLRCTYARPFHSCHVALATTMLRPPVTEPTGEVSRPPPRMRSRLREEGHGAERSRKRGGVRLNIPLDAAAATIGCGTVVRWHIADIAGDGRRARIPAACTARHHAGPGRLRGFRTAACRAARIA